MTVEEIEELRSSNDAPFDHQEFAIWLHNKIVEKINYDLWRLREEKQKDVKTYIVVNKIMRDIESLKPIN